jgi:hypothetical protein
MEQPGTQYTDVRGTAAADFHDPTSLLQFALAGGVDTQRYFPVGLKLYGETGLALSKIYAVDTLKAGGNTLQAVQAYLQVHPGDVEVFECAGPEIDGFMKRLEVILGHRDLLDLI